MVPPRTPKDRLQTLRVKALQQTVADPEFLAEAKKSKLVIDTVTGEDIERSVEADFDDYARKVKKKLMVLSPGKATQIEATSRTPHEP